jgi:hypothetical protein
VATKSGYVTLEVRNWRDEFFTDDIKNYIDNIKVEPIDITLTATSSLVSASVGGTFTFDVNPGPAYANKWYIILQGFSGTYPGFNINAGTVHVPLNTDIWTNIALGLNPFWPGFYTNLDASGFSSASMSTFGPQPVALYLTLYLCVMVLQNPSSTPIFATNPVHVTFTP